MKKMVMLLLYILIFQIFSINQEQIAFAEIANVQNEEKIDNNTYNDTGILPRITNHELYNDYINLECIDPYEIIIGDHFSLDYPIISAKDGLGNDIDFSKFTYSWKYRPAPVNVGDWSVLVIRYSSPDGTTIYKREVRVKVVGNDGRRAELKDTELYVGQKWDLGSVFKYATDRDGYLINLEKINDVWIDRNKTREIDTSRPGKHIVQIGVSSPRTKPLVFSNLGTVIVKEDKTKAELKDTELYVGQEWDLGSVFKNVVDKDGNAIKPEEVEWVWVDGKEKVREIDTSKPGKHTVSIAVRNAADRNYWVNSNTVTVTVKEDKTKAELKDTELYVGQKWDLGSVFKNVVDKDGNAIKPEEVEWVWVDGKEKVREIDTSKPGKHTVSIAVRNAADRNYWVNSNTVTVTVKEPFTIKQVPYFDFEDHILVSTNKLVINKKENPTIEVETPSIVGKDWQLQVELSPFLDKKNSKSILKGVSLYIPKGKLESDLETEEPTQYDCQLEANGKASILMHGTKTKGKGRWKNKLATKEITLSIPPENKKGNYESTLHWTLLDVPG
ncbi:bacterial Ig-like domain-containing protein [Enterococcus faecalis]|uniref:bacterial Ig-like domain-containing protein n=1 Tax=Enterococcus faecalis TaxID=1351 RepID=UPI0029355E0C|nr:bacterial Ig-like domain-containing protein [Enterococcus faecalis]MDV2914342.1 bacterial Ig-like domain-containing protein [Enterococcus faecalis]